MPAGLTIDPATGALSGTPTAAGTFDVRITARNAAGEAVLALQLVVNPAVAPIPTPGGIAMMPLSMLAAGFGASSLRRRG